MSTGVSDKARAIIAAWYSQRPNFAVMGEFSSGKSTLLNVIMGRRVLPTQVTATQLPVIWMTYGETPEVQGLCHDGRLVALPPGDPDPESWGRFMLIRLVTDSPALKLCDIIDSPGHSDPQLPKGALAFLDHVIDFVVWCTAANQAWRQTEKAAWTALPARLRKVSILAVTRIDKMKSERDRNRVLGRLETETGDLFAEIRPVASLQALAALQDGAVTNADLWQSSGAEALIEEIKLSIRVAVDACDARPTLKTPEPSSEAEVPGPDPVPSISTVDNPDLSTAHHNPASVAADTLHALREQLATEGKEVSILATIEQLRTALEADRDGDDAHAQVVVQCLSVTSLETCDPLRVLHQVEQDLEDFAEGPWCSLVETD